MTTDEKRERMLAIEKEREKRTLKAKLNGTFYLNPIRRISLSDEEELIEGAKIIEEILNTPNHPFRWIYDEALAKK